jgi:glycosyltransferase involved in cell wall biosynthesis
MRGSVDLYTKPRVVHVVDSLEIGGLERLVHDLIIARGGETTSVACLEAIGPFGEALQKEGVKVQLIGKEGGFVAIVWRLLRHLRRIQPDVVHCHNLTTFGYGAIAARLAGDVPVVMTKHGNLVTRTGVTGRLNGFLIRRADVVAVSREAGGIMGAWMPEGSRPVRCIANGISIGPYDDLPSREEARVQLGRPAPSFVVGIVARVTRGKGHLVLIDAFAGILNNIPGALLLIVGEGGLLPTVKARIRELALERSVLTLGERQDVPAILAALDVFCLPSETEGMPMTVLEAMAAGLPVVASNVGGIPEVVEEGRTGLMVPPRAVGALAAALLALAGDPERAREMGRLGRERLLKEFSLEQAVIAYEDVYREAVDRRCQ